MAETPIQNETIRFTVFKVVICLLRTNDVKARNEARWRLIPPSSKSEDSVFFACVSKY